MCTAASAPEGEGVARRSLVVALGRLQEWAPKSAGMTAVPVMKIIYYKSSGMSLLL